MFMHHFQSSCKFWLCKKCDKILLCIFMQTFNKKYTSSMHKRSMRVLHHKKKDTNKKLAHHRSKVEISTVHQTMCIFMTCKMLKFVLKNLWNLKVVKFALASISHFITKIFLSPSFPLHNAIKHNPSFEMQCKWHLLVQENMTEFSCNECVSTRGEMKETSES